MTTTEAMKTLTPEQKRVKIAERCGFRDIQTEESGKHSMGARDGEYHFLPSYLNDRNAMAEAEATLPVGLWNIYACNLEDICARDAAADDEKPGNPWAVFATAAQRAEAFLLTIEP